MLVSNDRETVMTDVSARLGLPYVAAGQLQKHVTVNEAMTRLDALVQSVVQSRTRSLPPTVVEEGAMFIVGPDPDDGWDGYEQGDLVRADIGGWVRIEPADGMRLTVLDEGAVVVRLNGEWRALAAVRQEALTIISDETLTVPAWARWVDMVCVGGGGAGAAGMSGYAATHRSGGGGGGAGGISRATYPAALLGELSVTIGAGGEASGEHGGETLITSASAVILKASGGRGGLAGQGGEGGFGTEGQSNDGLPTSRGPVPFSAGGGGEGSTLSSTDIVIAASSGQAGGIYTVAAAGGGAGSVGVGANGSTPPLPELGWLGGGGGGGAARTASTGYSGGDAGLYGAGGGGGGAGLTAAGGGGRGASGVVHLTFVG